MKINLKSKNATAKNLPVKVAPKAPLSATQAGKVAKHNSMPKPAKTAPVKPTIPGNLKWAQQVALLTGARGILARRVETATKDGKTYIRATQNENGLVLAKDKAIVCTLDNGTLTGEKEGRIQLGGYVNGKNTGAKVTFTTEAGFCKKAASAIVHWNNEDNGVRGYYLGNPHEKGICAVYVPEHKFIWQMELDTNAHNRHERGNIKPLKAGDKLPVVKW